MWYRSYLQKTAQALNIPGPIPNLPGAPPSAVPQYPLPPRDQKPAPAQQTPPSRHLPPQRRWNAQQVPKPHENCKCRLEMHPDGWVKWVANPDACDECFDLANEWNDEQMTLAYS